MKFLNPNVAFDGVVQIDGTITASNHAVTKQYLEANSVVGIDTGSSQFAEIVTVDGKKKLKLKPLTITSVHVETTATSIPSYMASNYSAGTEKQEGDIVIFTNITGATRPVSIIHNGGSAGTAADWTEIKGSDVQATEVRGFLTGSSGINYDQATGAITADQAEIRSFFSAGSGLSLNDGGSFSFTGSTDNVSEGSNLYFTNARARNALGVTDTPEIDLSYNSGTGAFSADLKNDSIENARLKNFSMSIAGQTVDLGGSITAATMLGAGNSGNLPEGSNLYFTDARARGAISVSDTAEIDLSYSDVGQISAQLKPNSIANGRLQNDTIQIAGANTALGGSISAASILSAGNSGSLPEGANLYFTDARSRGALQAAAGADNLLEYASGSGDLKVSLNKLRKDYQSQSLTAGAFATLNHALGKKLVHVTAMDSSGDLVQLEVQYQDNNNVKVKANSNVTVDIAVSL